MEIIWKDIPGYEGLYQVSNEGEIKSLSRKVKNKNNVDKNIKERIMKKQLADMGYYKIGLSDYNGVKKNHYIHRLVLSAFLYDSDKVVNHRDGIKTNNRLENLEYVTHKENLIHAYETGLRMSAARKYEKQIIEEYQKGKTQRDIQKKFKMCSRTLRKLLNDNDIEIRSNKVSNRKYDIDFQELETLFSKGVESKEIAKRFDVPIASIYQYKYLLKKGEKTD